MWTYFISGIMLLNNSQIVEELLQSLTEFEIKNCCLYYRLNWIVTNKSRLRKIKFLTCIMIKTGNRRVVEKHKQKKIVEMAKSVKYTN